MSSGKLISDGDLLVVNWDVPNVLGPSLITTHAVTDVRLCHGDILFVINQRDTLMAGYVRVLTANATTGWVQTRYLVHL